MNAKSSLVVVECHPEDIWNVDSIGGHITSKKGFSPLWVVQARDVLEPVVCGEELHQRGVVVGVVLHLGDDLVEIVVELITPRKPFKAFSFGMIGHGVFRK